MSLRDRETGGRAGAGPDVGPRPGLPFRLLLLPYPAAFRAEYGAEISRVLASRLRETGGRAAAFALWLETLRDTLANAPRVHADLLRQDLRWTIRSLNRSRGFALTAVAVTALGVGANAAVFSVADGVLLRPLPFPQAERLVKLWGSPPNYSRTELSPANYRDLRRLTTSVETMAAFTTASHNLVGVGEPTRIDGAAVTASLAPTLGIRPYLGRLPSEEDDREGAPAVLVLSHAAWLAEFGGDPDVLGRRVRLDDEEHEVIGVLPPDVHFPSRTTRFWRTFRFGNADYEDRSDNYLQAIGRLRPGVSIEQARSEAAVIARGLERDHPEDNAGTAISVIRLREEVSVQARLLLAGLVGASVCVLLIACANLAGLLLARALDRRRELTLRAALGAGRERLVRQMLTESFVLAVAGGALGVLVAVAAVPLLSALVPTTLPLGEPSALQGRVLAFTALLTCTTAFAFGVAPALRGSTGSIYAGLAGGARSGIGGRRERLRAGLVVAEVTFAVVLLVSAGLLLRALGRVQAVDPGFRSSGVLAVQTSLPWGRYGLTARRSTLYERVLEEVRALPGVSEAAYASFLPMDMKGGIWPVEDAVAEAPGEEPRASLRFVTPGFFRTMGIPLQRGRDVGDSDVREALRVAVVSASFATRAWPGNDPLGRRFKFAFEDRTVVGVVGDVRVRGPERDSEPQVYLPHAQLADSSLMGYLPKELVIRTSADPASLVPSVRRIVSRADPELPLGPVRALRDVVGAETAARRTQVRVLAVFAGLAIGLAALGLHGLLSYAVSQRTAEIGVRMALGARARDVLRLVLREGVALAALGALLGSVLAYVAGRSLGALLAGVAPADIATFSIAAAVVAATAVTGSVFPALHAARTDPTTAMRVE